MCSTHNTAAAAEVNDSVQGKVWLVTCSCGQLGTAIAEEALATRDKVGIAKSCGSAARLEAIYPDQCLVLDMDARNKGSCISAVAATVERFKSLDIVVTAPTRVHVGSVLESEEWQLQEQFNNTYQSVVNMTEAAIDVFRRQKSGHFINITDTNGSLGSPSLALLSSALHAVEGYSESTAVSEAEYGVKVSIVEAATEVTLITNSKYITQGENDSTKDLVANANVFPQRAFDDAVFAVMSIAGIKHPPMRLIAGNEPMNLIKERISNACEELSDFAFEAQNVEDAM